MKPRVLATAFAAALLLSSSAFAQAPMRPGRRATEPIYGSVERTKLLAQVRGARGTDGVLVLGSVERRAILTGQHVQQLPVQRPHSSNRRR